MASCTAENKQRVNILIKLGANLDFAREALNRTLLAHVMGIAGKSSLENKKTQKIVEIDLEGMNHIFSLRQIIENVYAFFKVFPGDVAVKKLIIQALDQFVYDTDATEKGFLNFEAGKPVVISAHSNNHRIFMILRKDPHRENTAQLMICNRGDGKKEHAIEHYVLPVEKVSEHILEKLVESYTNIEDFYEALEEMHITHEGGFDQKEQKIGSCSWSNAKGSFGILCRLYMGATPEEGNKVYKAFTQYVRKRIVERYEKLAQQPGSQPDLKLLEACKEKLIKKFSQ